MRTEQDARDPRVDPRPGDVVLFGPQWQLERYTVLGGTNDKRVQYQMGPLRAVLQTPISEWRKWSKGGEVLHVSQEGEKA